jgi:hypothetical protein
MESNTYVNVQGLAITSGTAGFYRDDDELVSRGPVAYASFLQMRLPGVICFDVEFQGGNDGDREGDEELEGQHGGRR